MYMDVTQQEISCLLYEDILNASAKATIFPWTPESSTGVEWVVRIQ